MLPSAAAAPPSTELSHGQGVQAAGGKLASSQVPRAAEPPRAAPVCATLSTAQRLKKLEEEAFGGANEGPILPRLKTLEQELMGAAQIGCMQQRIEALEAEILG